MLFKTLKGQDGEIKVTVEVSVVVVVWVRLMLQIYVIASALCVHL